MAEGQQPTRNGAPAPSDKKTAAKAKPTFVSPEAQKEAIELVRLRNDFYRDNYRRLIAILLLLLVLLCAMSYWIYYLSSHKPSPRYFATNAAGGLIPLIPMNQPSMSDAQLQNWAARAASAAFTFNYVQLNQQLELAKDTYFTDVGGGNYITALTNSGDLDAVTQGKFIVTAAPTGAPEIRARAPEGTRGTYYWTVSVPLQINYESVQQNVFSHRNVNVQMTIVRTTPLIDNAAPNVDGLQGIGVNQLLVQAATNNVVPGAGPTSTASLNNAVSTVT